METIQEMLPAPMVDMSSIDLDLLEMQGLCENCVEEYIHGTSSSPDCLLFRKERTSRFFRSWFERSENAQKATRPTAMELMMPAIRANLQMAVRNWVSRQSNPALGYNDFEFVPAQKKRHTEDVNAVIYLACRKEGSCSGDRGEFNNYNHIYAHEIPSFTKKISVIASQAFLTFNSNYANVGSDLNKYIRTFYPFVQHVEYSVEKSTAETYAKILSANYVVCPPGISCVLPALSTEFFISLMGNLPSWLTSLPENVRHIPDPQLQRELCQSLRGRNGWWIPDPDLAPFLQHSTHLSLKMPDNTYKENPTLVVSSPSPTIPEITKYKWTEWFPHVCELNVLTVEGICKYFTDNDMRRIMIVGDVTAHNQAESLLKILGRSSFIPQEGSWNTNIPCPQYVDTMSNPKTPTKFVEEISFYFIRSDFLHEIEWLPAYESSLQKTLLIATTGVMQETLAQYTEVFDIFLQNIDDSGRNEDKIFFRSTHPGDVDLVCEKFREPFQNYDAVLRYDRRKRMQKSVQFNNYAENVLEDRRRIQINKSVHVQYLDVFKMTVLRPDAHVEGDEQNCLQYKSPGVPDWWNFLWYSDLSPVRFDFWKPSDLTNQK